MARDLADIEDIQGNVIGKIDTKTMRVIAPNREVDAAAEAGEPLFMRKDGIRSPISQEKPKRRRR